MDKGHTILAVVAVVCTTIAICTAMYLVHQDKVTFVTNGYEQVSVPGIDYSKWQKAR